MSVPAPLLRTVAVTTGAPACERPPFGLEMAYLTRTTGPPTRTYMRIPTRFTSLTDAVLESAFTDAHTTEYRSPLEACGGTVTSTVTTFACPGARRRALWLNLVQCASWFFLLPSAKAKAPCRMLAPAAYIETSCGRAVVFETSTFELMLWPAAIEPVM